MPMKDAVCFSLAVLMPHIIACGISAPAAEPAEPKTITIGGETYTVVPDEQVRAFGLEFPNVAPEDNAATYYLRAFRVYWPQTWRDKRELAHLRDDVATNGWNDRAAPLLEYLKKNEEALALIRRAAGKPVCHFPVLVGEGQTLEEAGPYGIAIPFVSRMRDLARLLCTLGRAREFEGRYAEALDAYLLSLRFGGHLAQGPGLLIGLVGLNCDTIGMRAIEQCLLRNEIDEAVLARGQKRFEQLLHTRPDVRVGMLGERALTAELIEWFIRDPVHLFAEEDEKPPFLQRLLARIVVRSKPVSTQWRQDVVDFWRDVDALLAMPLRDCIRSGAEDDFLEAAHTPRDPPNLVAILAPAVARARLSYVRHEVRWTVVDVMFALARYKAKHGEYPEKLDDVKDLMLMDGVDPFSGELLKYRRERDGSFTLWSMGDNLTDDGGKVAPGRRWHQDDYVWNSALICGAN